MKGQKAIELINTISNIGTVLDVGSGGGEQAQAFADVGKNVTCVDRGQSPKFKRDTILSS